MTRELLAIGEKVREREVDTYSQLTPQEEHIVRLARDGRTNPEIAAELESVFQVIDSIDRTVRADGSRSFGGTAPVDSRERAAAFICALPQTRVRPG